MILLLTFLSDGHSCLLDRLSSSDLFPVNLEDQPAVSRQILEVPESHLASELHLGKGPSQIEQELLHLANSSPVDLLCAPVPSCLPSPQLRPDPVILQPTDLIQFEEHPQEPLGVLVLNQEEKSEIPILVKKGNLSCDSSPSSLASAPALPIPSSEAPRPLISKEAVESPARKQPKNRVKLAANFSFAPVTKL